MIFDLLLLKPSMPAESPTSPASCLDTPRDSQKSLAPPDPHAPVGVLLGLPQFNAYKWPYTWVNAVVTPLIGAITPLWTGRGPPCRANCHFKQILFLHGLPCKIFIACTKAIPPENFPKCSKDRKLKKICWGDSKEYLPEKEKEKILILKN